MLRYMVVADPNAGQDTVVHVRVPKPDAVPLDCRELGTPSSWTGEDLGVRRNTNVPRDTEGRGSPPRLQGAGASSRRHRTGTALQENQEHGNRSAPPGQQEQEPTPRNPTKHPHYTNRHTPYTTRHPGTDRQAQPA
ncbi:hypothetical protein D4764_21G0002590 [Takifugu flavidus]|uniref:Uncharacterized protein n=1 Tax=Takifugu flavidus TaxID=433684 RepID=A0A5C6NFB3_9TELE|nr:hypothetical protein D4764_21G0002590 [Takifugu flavidus]